MRNCTSAVEKRLRLFYFTRGLNKTRFTVVKAVKLRAVRVVHGDETEKQLREVAVYGSPSTILSYFCFEVGTHTTLKIRYTI